MGGLLALVGGMGWRDMCTFDRDLLDASGGHEVLVLPPAAAYEHPQRAVDTAESWFAGLGAKVRPCMVLTRPDAESEEHAHAPTRWHRPEWPSPPSTRAPRWSAGGGGRWRAGGAGRVTVWLDARRSRWRPSPLEVADLLG